MPYKDKLVKKAYDKARYLENLKYLNEYKMSKGCADCGYNAHPAGLEFDHLRDKYKNVTAMLSGTFARLLSEIEKCEVVCGTCHNIRTYNRKIMVPEPEALGA